MSALTQRLQSLLRRKSSGSYGHMQSIEGVPFYEARPPWWAKFTWGFIAADLIVTSTMTELTWTKWTLPPEKPGDAPVRRPAWQRAGLCLAHLSLGVGFATLLLVSRSRIVRILQVIPASSSSGGAPKQLLIAGARRRGADVRGHWWIGLNRARLRGVQVPAVRLRDAFMSEWGIRKTRGGDVDVGTGRWKSGPVLENS
ncbi:hypothetical protein EDB85DRAFT_2139287 [Lactarius pseudohatsudake]|nr:hypothetical protein EDB85DRAFT_2139287 [Lactarius pseudohatsudake]